MKALTPPADLAEYNTQFVAYLEAALEEPTSLVTTAPPEPPADARRRMAALSGRLGPGKRGPLGVGIENQDTKAATVILGGKVDRDGGFARAALLPGKRDDSAHRRKARRSDVRSSKSLHVRTFRRPDVRTFNRPVPFIGLSDGSPRLQ